MASDALIPSLLVTIGLGAVAVFTFESIKADMKYDHELCVCGHSRTGHQLPDYKCQGCLCRQFHGSGRWA